MLIVDLNVKSERNGIDSSPVTSAAITSKQRQAAAGVRKKQAAAVLVNFIATQSNGAILRLSMQ